MRRVWIVVGAVALMAVWPETVAACPVCFDASDENRQAFLATTAFLSLLPLGLVSGVGLWIRRRVRSLESEGNEGAGSE